MLSALSQPEWLILNPEFVPVVTWKQEVLTDPFFAPIFKGAAASLGGTVDRTGHGKRSGGGGSPVRPRRGQSPPMHYPKMSWHCSRMAFWAPENRQPLYYWPGKNRDVAAYILSRDTCERTKVEYIGPRGLLYPLKKAGWHFSGGLVPIMGLTWTAKFEPGPGPRRLPVGKL
jgi:hypothetical protein